MQIVKCVRCDKEITELELQQFELEREAHEELLCDTCYEEYYHDMQQYLYDMYYACPNGCCACCGCSCDYDYDYEDYDYEDNDN